MEKAIWKHSEVQGIDKVYLDYDDIDYSTPEEKPVPDVSFSLEDVELMQFTGLLDKQGKEIYEGDILCYGTWSDGKGKCLYKVFWNEEDARFDTPDLRHNQEMTHVDTYEAEVIGNIKENPELLNNIEVEK